MFCLPVALHAAEPPTLTYVYPAGGRVGTTVSVSLGGKHKPWPVGTWIDGDGVTIKVAKDEGKLSIEIAKDASPGVRLLRIHTDEGASAPRWFVVGTHPESLEAEPNDDARKAQAIEKLPVTVNGRLEKTGDADSFAVILEAGQWLVAALDAYGIGAPIDASLELLDADGRMVAFNNDGRGFDPLLAHKAATPGRYVLRVFGFAEPARADVRFAGDASAVYRLTITTGPYVHYAFPLAVPRGRKTPVHLFGWNLGSTGHAVVHTVDTSSAAADAQRLALVPPHMAPHVSVLIADRPLARENEPNDTRDLAHAVTSPAALAGRIEPAGDEDRFSFHAEKGQRLTIALRTADLILPFDPVLAVEDAAGKQLAANDDGGDGQDPRLSWTAPETGTYVVAVRDLFGAGRADYVYHLELTPPQPDFRVTVDNHTYRLAPGAQATVTATVTRIDGFAGDIFVTANDLPAGVTATSAPVPAKGGAVKLTLTAAADAKPARGPVRILAIAPDEHPPRVRRAAASVRGADVTKPRTVDTTHHIWVAVTPKPDQD